MANAQKLKIDLEIARLEYKDATRPQHAELFLETDKGYDGGIRSEAKVYWIGLHSRSHCMAIYGDGGDFSQTLHRTPKTVRATQKAIDTQHAAVFTPEKIAELTESAKTYYASALDKIA